MTIDFDFILYTTFVLFFISNVVYKKCARELKELLGEEDLSSGDTWELVKE